MRRLNLLWIGLVGFTWALGVPACSDNESEHSTDGGGGSSGNPGATNTQGSGATTTNTTGSNLSSEIGAACESDQDCQTGLECLTSRSESLTEGGPSHGFCSFRCGDEQTLVADADAECKKLDPNSLCHYFDPDTAYCVQRCTFGNTDKCQGRSDVVCDLVIHEAPGGAVSCTSNDDCDIDDQCLATSEGGTEGTCFAIPQVCLPRCNTDQDCTPGRFCDPRSGECIDDEPTGKPFDEPCDPDAEVDECAGSCASDGICIQKCVLGAYPACGSTSTTNATGDCLFFAYQNTAQGDVGLCGALCDCTDDCRGDLECVQFDTMEGPYEYLGRKGYCGVKGADSVVLDSCEGTGGMGGAGGTSGGGQAGEGGSP